jgi:putative thioredoxin
MDKMSLDGSAVAGGALVANGSTATFQKDVLDASRDVPVLVDFWAPWCGPCRTLGPAIERVVNDLKGKVRLVKINVDENQALAGQMGVQSIPAVFAFAGGRPVDGFMGAIPESEIRRFVDKVIKGAPNGASDGPDLGEVLKAASEAVATGDYASAEQIYGALLNQQPDNADALMGLAALYEKTGHLDQVKAVLAAVPEDGQKRDDYQALARAVALAEEAASLGSIEDLERRVATNEDDHQARYDLALALNAKGFRIEAAEALVTLMRRDRTWNDDGARKKLLELIEAWGPKDPATLKGRRLLSAALFS